jgi:DNA helicase-2/ATP-dependent DNA helicase PcrA
MRILELLTDADLSPNIMTVGDYKQAIFRFQGAEVANMERFAARFGDKLKLVELEYNYRSGEEILAVAEGVIRQNTPLGFMRRLADKLRAWQAGRATTVREVTAADWASELAYVAEDIERQIAAGVAPERVAVIAKYHRDLVDLVPYLRARGVPLQYEREQDVLASPPVKQLVLLARVVTLVARQDLAGANVLLPEVLAQGAWGFSAVELGRLALAGQYKNWLEVMIDGEEKWRAAAERILELAQVAQTKTLEEMLDAVFAIYREWFFGEEKLREAPDEYLTYLANLTGLRRLVREYKGGDDLSLFDFVELIDSYERLGERITVTRRWQAGSRVQLLTAHKAKGLEFDTVYIINGTNENWARSGGGRRGVVWPANLPLAIDDSEDEHLRLFYVAVTRAERQLFITTHKFDEKGKATLPCGYLADAEMERVEVAPAEVMEQIKNLETEWFGAIASEVAELKDLLAPKLEKYKLSPTHLGTFTDLEYGGPQEFLKRHLLQFPEAKAASAGYGTAVHEALQFVHGHMAKEGVMPKVEAVLGHFEAALEREHLARGDYEKYLEKGRGDLAVFVEKFDFRPGQIAERKFSGENVVVDGVRLNGTVDMLVVDKGARTVEVYDYKTGRAHEKWERKTKLHKYRQQLLFYKLLIEGSREFAGYTVTRGVLQFVEPVEREIVSLEIDYGTTGEELERFRKLVGAVWGRIMELELPEMAKYEKSLAGSLGFERDLVREDGGN